MDLHIDIETYSSEEIRIAGIYKYTESIDFEIILVAYAFDHGEVKIVDLLQGEKLPAEFIEALTDPTVKKCAHNAAFERQAFKQAGYYTPASEWYCSLIKAAYCGWPLSLEDVSKAMKLEEKGKASTGTALINYFCKPCKPTKVNTGRTRNFPTHHPEKWEEFKKYCIQDVEAEREVAARLSNHRIPDTERANYILDQQINDRGVLIDVQMARNAFEMNNTQTAMLKSEMERLTGLENPNSPAQLQKWLSNAIGREITTVAKDAINSLMEETGPGLVSDVLDLRKQSSKTSVKKYASMLNCACEDGRGRGLFQFYGAMRTGRWAGRIVQLQNLPKNFIETLDVAKSVVSSGDLDLLSTLYNNPSSVLSQLIRTAFIASNKSIFAVSDFSSIEARVIAWLSGEQWRLKVFESHGKIYEASASLMFGVPIEHVTKTSDYRAKGKIAELALGYQGSTGAIARMLDQGEGNYEGEKEPSKVLDLSESEMKIIVNKWRKANPAICQLWKDVEACAKNVLRHKKKMTSRIKGLVFEYDGEALTIKLPSGRKLFYQNPSFTINKFKSESIRYKGMDQETKQWGYVDTYGGKLVENIVQAIARDLLAEAMLRLDASGYKIVMHVHDEAVCEIMNVDPEKHLKKICDIMSIVPVWAKGLPLGADGYLTPFYKKD
jgi:DNA polymerase